MKNNWYMDPEELAAAVLESQRMDAPTERVCRMFRLIAERLTGSPRYAHYSLDDKADMVSAALEKMIKNIKNYRPERGAKAFNYFTMCAEQAFWQFLKKHYGWINKRRMAA